MTVVLEKSEDAGMLSRGLGFREKSVSSGNPKEMSVNTISTGIFDFIIRVRRTPSSGSE